MKIDSAVNLFLLQLRNNVKFVNFAYYGKNSTRKSELEL